MKLTALLAQENMEWKGLGYKGRPPRSLAAWDRSLELCGRQSPQGWQASDKPWLGLFLQLRFLLLVKKTLGLDVSWGCGERHSKRGPFSNEDAREGLFI